MFCIGHLALLLRNVMVAALSLWCPWPRDEVFCAQRGCAALSFSVLVGETGPALAPKPWQCPSYPWLSSSSIEIDNLGYLNSLPHVWETWGPGLLLSFRPKVLQKQCRIPMLDHQTSDINLVKYLSKHLKGPLPSNLTELQSGQIQICKVCDIKPEKTEKCKGWILTSLPPF